MARPDDHVVWEGTSGSARVHGSYRLTRDTLSIDVEGAHPTRDVIPLEIIVKADVARSLSQRLRGSAMFGWSSIARRDPSSRSRRCAIWRMPRARDAIIEQADRVRRDAIVRRFEAESRRTTVSNAAPPETVSSGVELPITQQLRELAALHDGGVVTDEEFQRLKARLIDG